MKKRRRNREAEPAAEPTMQLVRRPLFELPAAPTPPTISDPVPPARRVNPNAIRNFSELLQALAAKKVQITLAADLLADKDIVINYDVTINFNGHSIISEESKLGARVIDIRRGEVNLIGQGKIFAMGADSIAVRIFGAISASVPHYTAVTIEEGIHLYAPDGSGILIASNLGAAYGVRVDFSGEIIARSGICLAQSVRGGEGDQPMIRVRSGASIIADETHGSAIEAAGIGRWRIEACNLYGKNGLHALAGRFNLLHSHVIAVDSALEFAGDSLICAEIDYGVLVSETGLAILGDPNIVQRLIIRDSSCHGAFGAYNRELASVIRADNTEFDNRPADFLPKSTVPEVQYSASTSPVIAIPQPESTIEPAAELSKPNPATESVQPELVVAEILPGAEPNQFANAAFSDPAPAIQEENAPSEPANSTPVISPETAPIEVAPDPASAADERAVVREALYQALDAMKNLSSADYISGFRNFQKTVQKAEDLLADPDSDLAEIRDTASNLLSALDHLDASDNLSLTDDELDQLFYQGAILQEATDNSDHQKTPNQTATIETFDEEIAPSSTPEILPVATISTGDVTDHDPIEYEEIDEFEELANALHDLSPADPASRAIGQAAISLAQAHINSEHATNLDELTPIAHWSTGTTSIDEQTPYSYQEYLANLPERRAINGVTHWFRSLRAGFSAGVNAFRDASKQPHY